jgi:hypothetical protein
LGVGEEWRGRERRKIAEDETRTMEMEMVQGSAMVSDSETRTCPPCPTTAMPPSNPRLRSACALAGGILLAVALSSERWFVDGAACATAAARERALDWPPCDPAD